jgi:hypothetical protein
MERCTDCHIDVFHNVQATIHAGLDGFSVNGGRGGGRLVLSHRGQRRHGQLQPNPHCPGWRLRPKVVNSFGVLFRQVDSLLPHDSLVSVHCVEKPGFLPDSNRQHTVAPTWAEYLLPCVSGFHTAEVGY